MRRYAVVGKGIGKTRIQENFAAAALQGGGQYQAVSRVRAGLAYAWVQLLGRSGRKLAELLNVRPESVYKAARRG